MRPSTVVQSAGLKNGTVKWWLVMGVDRVKCLVWCLIKLYCQMHLNLYLPVFLWSLYVNHDHLINFIFTLNSEFGDINLYLELSKVEQTWQLEGAPLVEIDSRTEEIEGESSRHGTEELKKGEFLTWLLVLYAMNIHIIIHTSRPFMAFQVFLFLRELRKKCDQQSLWFLK